MTTLAEQIWKGSPVPQLYDKIALPSRHTAQFISEELRNLPSNARVLDVGVGTGIVAKKLLQDLDIRLDGVDTSSNMLAAACEVLPEGTRLYKSSATSLPVPARSYDVVLYNYILRYMIPADTNDVFSEAARVSKPGAKVIISDLNFPRLRPFKQPLEESADPNVLGIWAAYSREEFIQKAHEYGFVHNKTCYPFLSFMMVFAKGDT